MFNRLKELSSLVNNSFIESSFLILKHISLIELSLSLIDP